MVPLKCRSGYASSPTSTGCPARRSIMSAWLTRARTRIDAGFTTSTTGNPERTSSPSWTSAMLPPFQIVLRTATPAIGELISIFSALASACVIAVEFDEQIAGAQGGARTHHAHDDERVRVLPGDARHVDGRRFDRLHRAAQARAADELPPRDFEGLAGARLGRRFGAPRGHIQSGGGNRRKDERRNQELRSQIGRAHV